MFDALTGFCEYGDLELDDAKGVEMRNTSVASKGVRSLNTLK